MSGDITTSNGQRIGLSVPLEGVPLGTHGELMAEWKSLGYTDLWSSEGNETDAFTPLVVAACSAPGLHLGTAIVPVFSRGPAVLAQSAASLAELAPGHFTLGLGSSSHLIAELWNAATFEQPYERMRSTLLFLHDAFEGKSIDGDYGAFRVGMYKLGLLLAEPPRILIAALREKMLRLSGTDADGAILTWVTASDVSRMAPFVRESGDDKQIVARIWVAPTEDTEAAHWIGRRLTAVFLNSPALRASQEWLGRGPMLSEAWRRWDEGNFKASAAAIPVELLDELVVSGTPQDVHRRVDEYRANGVDVPVMAFIPVRDVDLVDAARQYAPIS